jgi:hypothetical protein
MNSNSKMQILSLKSTARVPCMLAPTPNVSEAEYIAEIMKADSTPQITELSVGSVLRCLTTYRGHMLYCAGGVTVHRVSPTTDGGNGRVCYPDNGHEEDVLIMAEPGWYRARVKF